VAVLATTGDSVCTFTLQEKINQSYQETKKREHHKKRREREKRGKSRDARGGRRASGGEKKKPPREKIRKEGHA